MAEVMAEEPAGGERLYALTIWQPWASLIMAGAKRYEFRSYPAPAGMTGRRFVVHAGTRRIVRGEVAELLYRLEKEPQGTGLDPAIAQPLLERVHANPNVLPLAAGLGTALLGRPRLATEIYAGVMDSDRIDHSMWGWPLSEIASFGMPVPCRGYQGFWPWPAGLDVTVEEAG